MSNEELEKDTLGETQQTEDVEQTQPSAVETEGEGEQQTDAEIDWRTRAEQAEEEAREARRVADTYKKENEKYRKPKREIVSETSVKETPQDNLIEHDYLSKRKDVLDEVQSDIQSLNDEEWTKIEHLMSPAIDALYQKALKKGDYVARGEIKRTVEGLVKYAKGESSKKAEVEEARMKGAMEMTAMENAEISGVKFRKTTTGGASDADKKRAEETGRTPEQEKELRLKREAREKEYAVNDPLARHGL